MASRGAKGHAARGVTPLRLTIKACPSAVRVVCREAETCPCEGSAVQPLQWPQAFRWDRLERKTSVVVRLLCPNHRETFRMSCVACNTTIALVWRSTWGDTCLACSVEHFRSAVSV